MTANKLVQRYTEIETEFEAIRRMAGENTDISALEERVARLEAKQADLRKTLMQFIALSKLKEETWRTLSYGVSSYH